MNKKVLNNKAFSLIELLVAIGVLVVVMVFSSAIFKTSINTYRTALANAEIMQKLRAITAQLDADFKGLDKNAEIFVAWQASAVPDTSVIDNDMDGYERFDRIMFFSSGDFYSYGASPSVRGNTAMICYMLAKNNNGTPDNQNRNKRILTRTQHILTAEQSLPDFFSPGSFNDIKWNQWRNIYEYDKIFIEQWKQMQWENKRDTLSVIGDVIISGSKPGENARGATVELTDANSIHLLFCEGVGEFKIQGWSDSLKQWIPEVDPDGNGNLSDSHFFLSSSDPNHIPALLYPYPPYGQVSINHISYPREQVNRDHFSTIPGLGRAIKLTFTLYDSKNIIKKGRTFTHIVYLDD
jgi:prepilin-type N-terminal cleavage/methylation domain-containing protein